jgi:hypothetical protein
VLSYDEASGFILLLDSDGKTAILVDMTLCLASWKLEKLGVVTVVGYAESSPVRNIPPHPEHTLNPNT